MQRVTKMMVTIFILLIYLFTTCKKTESVALNTAPIAMAGNDTIIEFAATSFLLDGSASSDAENNIVNYKWKLVSGQPVNIAKPDSARTRVENLIEGAYRFRLMVTDGNGLNSSDDFLILVTKLPILNDSKTLNDTTVRLPFNRALLKGVSQIYPEIKFSWAKISGPNSFSFQKLTSGGTTYPNLKYATVSNLVEGIYKFEVTASFTSPFFYQFPKDTITLTVLRDTNIYTNEKLFDKQVWSCSCGCQANIINFASIVSSGKPFKVYLKRNASSDWDIVFPAQLDSSINRSNLYEYAYSIENNVMSIDTWEGGSAPFEPTIKILY